MIRIFAVWLIAFVSLAVGLTSHNLQLEIILTSLSVALVIYSEKMLDREYIKYHEKK